jgi:hypothetical protein
VTITGRRPMSWQECEPLVVRFCEQAGSLGAVCADRLLPAQAAPRQAGNLAEILFSPALLHRAARYISGAADLAAKGGRLPDGIPETARNRPAATLGPGRGRTDRDHGHRLILTPANALSKSERSPSWLLRSEWVTMRDSKRLYAPSVPARSCPSYFRE